MQELRSILQSLERQGAKLVIASQLRLLIAIRQSYTVYPLESSFYTLRPASVISPPSELLYMRLNESSAYYNPRCGEVTTGTGGDDCEARGCSVKISILQVQRRVDEGHTGCCGKLV